MHPAPGILLLAAVTAMAAAPVQPARPVTITSRSGQFLVQGPAAIAPSPGFLTAPQRTNYVTVDQARLAVMCERIKQALLGQLQAADHWQGRVSLSIYRAGDLGEPVFVRAQYTQNGWIYHLDVPSEVEAGRLVRTLTAVLLQEMADRRAGSRPAELPPWLARGLAAQIETVSGANFILEDQTKMVRIERKIEPLVEIRRRLGDQMPLGLDELNWPDEEQITGPPGGYYEACAHLMVLQLLRLNGGAECFRAMLGQSAQNLNWQTAFLKAFATHFKTLRDTDKWWGLQIASFTGRDPAQTYTLKESWQKLEEILAAPVKLRAAEGKMPERATVNLQTVIGEWDYARQKPVLRQKITQLQMLHLRVSPALLRLTDDYCAALINYLARREKAGFGAEARGMVAETPRLLARKTVETLNHLDVVRADLKNLSLEGGLKEAPAPSAR